MPIGKIVCVGRNYAAHAKELGNEIPEFPVEFIKPTTAIIYSGENIIHPDFANDLHHEVELVLYIGETVKNVDDDATAWRAIHGYAVGLDMTMRDLQNQLKDKGDPWTLSKCFDTSAVLSTFVTKDEYKLRGDEQISLSVNGKVRQNSSIKNMLFSCNEIIKYTSHRLTLEKGDLVFTGTPEGVSKVVPGDVITAEIPGIGEIKTKVVK